MKISKFMSERLQLHLAEVRTDRALVEAVAIEERYTELLAVVGTDRRASEVLGMAVELAKLGVRAEDVFPMVQLWQSLNGRGATGRGQGAHGEQ